MSFEAPKNTSHPCAPRGFKTASPQILCGIKIGKSTTQNAFFECKKRLRTGSFADPWCKRMTSTFLGTSKLILSGVRGPRSLLHVECPPDSQEKCWFTY